MANMVVLDELVRPSLFFMQLVESLPNSHAVETALKKTNLTLARMVAQNEGPLRDPDSIQTGEYSVIQDLFRNQSTVDDLKPASPKIHHTTITPRVLVYLVM